MFLVAPSGVIDFDLDLFVDVATILDKHIAFVTDPAVDFDIADQMGLFNRAEHASGLGFAACQAYLVSTYGDLRIPKKDALTMGPKYTSGTALVAIVNAAANFWKHSAEWPLEAASSGRTRIEEIFDALALPDADYPLFGALTALATPGEARLMALVPALEAWRDELAADPRCRP